MLRAFEGFADLETSSAIGTSSCRIDGVETIWN
jgi:hypothetical protein